MKQEKVRKHIFFYGRVQGVGFRYYAVQKANQLGKLYLYLGYGR